jgi:hypothetical protein
MELDQLRSIWQNDVAQSKEDAQLLSIMSRRSNNPIARMKRNLFLELVAIIILYGFTIAYYAYAFHGKMSEVSWFMIGIAFCFFIYYYRKNRLLNKMECLSCQVKSNLQRQVNTLEKYVKFYLIAGTLLVPLTIIFFSWLIYVKSPLKPRSILYHSAAYPWWQTILAWVAIVGICTVLIYYLNKWYVKKLYGNHILKLKELLTEMDAG